MAHTAYFRPHYQMGYDETPAHHHHHYDYNNFYRPIVQRANMRYYIYAENDFCQQHNCVDNYKNESNRATRYIYDHGYATRSLIKEILDKPIVNELMYPDLEEKPNKQISFRLPNLGSEEILECVKSDTAPEPQRMDWNNYHRLGIIHTFMEDLEKEYPSLCSTGVIGQSLEGRDMKVLKISNSDASNSAVWIDAGIHAREWIAPAVNTYVANYIANNFHSMPRSVTNKDWYFLPVMNPDGYEYSHTTNRMWRKNTAYHAGQLCGVDLNRNFSFGWGGKGSSDIPTNCFYRGPEPFSEPESCSVKEFILNSGVTFKVYITLHSFGEVIIFPFASRDDLCPDYIRLLEGATVMSKAIYSTNGNTYKVGISKDVMYRASGTSNDWCYGAAGIPYCYLIELRSKKHKFRLPQEKIEETGREILNCVVALMDFVDESCGAEVRSDAKV